MKKYYKYELNMTIMNILSIVLVVIPLIILIVIKYPIFEIDHPGVFLFCLFIYFLMHEFLHGLGYLLFAKDKKNIKFGIALEKGVLFAACQEKLGKKEILVSLLLPLIILSFVAFPLGFIFKQNWLMFYAVLNFGGAVADILMTYLIATAPKDVEYIDYNTDIGAYLLSKQDMCNHKTLGFIQTESGDSSKKEVDRSIKRIYISPFSAIILGVLFLLCLGDLVINIIK